MPVAALRQEGFTRNLPGDAAERFFALGFAFDRCPATSRIWHAVWPSPQGRPRSGRAARPTNNP